MNKLQSVFQGTFGHHRSDLIALDLDFKVFRKFQHHEIIANLRDFA